MPIRRTNDAASTIQLIVNNYQQLIDQLIVYNRSSSIT